MHKVLNKGISLASKYSLKSSNYGFKSSINAAFNNIRPTGFMAHKNNAISFQFSSTPNQNNRSAYNSYNSSVSNQYGNDKKVWEQDKARTQGQQTPIIKQNQKFFSSQTQTSTHFVLKEEEILTVIQKFNLPYKSSSYNQEIKIEWCPFCTKPHNNDITNSYTLNIKKSSGQFYCFRCQINGSWWDFKNLLYKNISVRDIKEYNEIQYQDERMDDSEFYLYHNQLFDKETYKVELEYLCGKSDNKQRHINFETLVKYKVGIGKEEFVNRDGDYIKIPVVYFPMFKYQKPAANNKDASKGDQAKNVFDEEEKEAAQGEQSKRITISTANYKLVKAKIRGIGPENKPFMRIKPSGSKSGIFGLNTIPPNAKEVVITEGEYDAMAVHQATGLPAISLPNGASTFPLEAIGCLDQFERIYLWLDNDEVGKNNRGRLAEKLGLNRTYIVTTLGEKDANDILRQDPSRILKYINDSITVPDQNILTFSDLKEQVLHRLIKFENNQGIRSRCFNFYNETIKGLRKGEMTVLTGPTGSGKTTFLSQLSLDFCKQQVPTLWGSFEIKNEILATNMLLQMSGQDLYKQQQIFPYWSDRFDMIPMYFMNFFGSTGLDQILSTIDYAIYKYDIQHVVIDNLQFLLGTQARGFDKFDMQDKAIESFRQLATKRDIHLTLVIHPKKVEENEDLNISSVFGSAKATQEADNVVILQNREKFRLIDIKKNRFNGDIGKKGIIFDKSNKNFYEMSSSEVSQILSSSVKTSEIIKQRREQMLERIEEEDLIQPINDHQKRKQNIKPTNGNNDDDNNNGGENGNGGSSNDNPPDQQPPQEPPSSENNQQPPPSYSSLSGQQQEFNDSSNKQQNENIKQQAEDKFIVNSTVSKNEDEQPQQSQNALKRKATKVSSKVKVSSKATSEQEDVQDNINELDIDQIESMHKNSQAIDQLEECLSLNYNYDESDDYNEAINEQCILNELNTKSNTNTNSSQTSTKKKQQKYKPEEYDSDSLEPMYYNLFRQDLQVEPTTTFFKNFSPVPAEEREDLLNGSFKTPKQNNYYQAGNYKNNQNYKQKNFKNAEEIFNEELLQDNLNNQDIDDQIEQSKHKFFKSQVKDSNTEKQWEEQKNQQKI